ncbi:hypothetical protein BKA64DRAFT_715251 [Cadophora sp. MPI-SDFR-AT-0126]|nr:hypothetical protein BKA64DRAFT_715251 [Leotiomycetes sp. MPI-SDFR-AT-0126]
MQSMHIEAKRQLSLKNDMEMEGESAILLKSIISTLQRLEQHVTEQNRQLGIIASSVPFNYRGNSSWNDLWQANDVHLKRIPAIPAVFTTDNVASIPITPPDSISESPATPYSRVVSELQEKFAFLDSDNESETMAPSTSVRREEFPEEIQNVSFAKRPGKDIDLYGYDGSVYSTDLLSSHLAQATVGRAMTPIPLDLVKAPGQQKKEPEPHDIVQAAGSQVPQSEGRRWKLTRRGLHRGRDHVWGQTTARAIKGLKSFKELFRGLQVKLQLCIAWLGVALTKRKIAILKAFHRLQDKMLVTKVFYYE